MFGLVNRSDQKLWLTILHTYIDRERSATFACFYTFPKPHTRALGFKHGAFTTCAMANQWEEKQQPKPFLLIRHWWWQWPPDSSCIFVLFSSPSSWHLFSIEEFARWIQYFFQPRDDFVRHKRQFQLLLTLLYFIYFNWGETKYVRSWRGDFSNQIGSCGLLL